MELLVVPEPWDTHLEGPVPSYYVEQDDLEFEGSWRLEDGKAIVPAGISQYNAYLSRITPPDNPMILKGRDDDVQSLESWDLDGPNTKSSDFMENLDIESSSTNKSLEDESEDRISLEYREIKKQGKDAYRKVADWRNKCLRQSPASGWPTPGNDRQETSQANDLNKISMPKHERDRQSLLGVLKFLIGGVSALDDTASIELKVPADFPQTNNQITLYTKEEGKCVYYPRRRLPLTCLKSVHTCNFAKCINTYIL